MSRTTIRGLATSLLLGALLACSEKQPAGTVRETIRLSPEAITAADMEAGLLVDRDTTAPVRIAKTTTVTLRFRHDVEVRRVKAHGARALRVSADGLSLGAEDDAGWAAGELSSPVTTRELVLTLEPSGPDAAVNELEIWGAGNEVETRDVAAAASGTADEKGPERENVWVLRGEPGSATLRPGAGDGGACVRARFPAADPRQARRAYLVYEANVPRAVALQHGFDAGAPASGFWLGTTPDSRTTVREIDPERLRGADELLLCVPDDADGTVSVQGIRLLLALEDGREAFDRLAPHPLRAALDRDDATSASVPAGEHVLELDRGRDVEAASLRIAHVPARLEGLARRDGATWVDEGAVELATKATALPVKGKASALRVSFAGPARADVPAAAVTELEVKGSGVGPRTGAARIVLTYPATTQRDDKEVGERFGPKAYLSGWAESPAGRGTVELAGARVDVDGAFAQVVRRPLDATGSWPVTLRARFPDGTEVSRTVYLDDDREAELLGGQSGAGVGSDDARFGRENQTRYGAFDPAAGGTVALGTDVYLVAPPGAVGAKTSVGIARKGHEVMPHLDAGMINVTAPAHAAYRFLPKGQKFQKPVKVVLPYDPDLLPEGVLPEEVQTYYFDEAKDRWQTLPRREVLRGPKQVVSETTHFTFMINAVMVLPDHPGPVSFNPNSIKDLKAADPSANIDLVEPPQGNNQGTARLAFPFRLPKARGAYQPALSLSYDSGGGNGWVGVGWDVPVSRVTIDARYGVPEYGGQERYLLDGEAIVPVDREAVSGKCVDAAVAGREYRARVERDFRRIVRCGEDPTRYWFEVVDKGGTLFVYGHGENARLTSYLPRVTMPPVFPPIYDVAEWHLERVVDANGNLTEFAYQHDSPAGPEAVHRETFRQVYLRSIQYSGTAPRRTGAALTDGTPGIYLVELHHQPALRGDEVISARTGFKSVLRRRLGSVEVRALAGTPSGLVRRYVLGYRTGDMRKSLLEKVEVQGADESVFYSHQFGYEEKAPDEAGVTLFGEPVQWTMDSRDYGLGGSAEWSFGFHGFVGIGWSPYKGGGTVGVGFGYGRRQGETLVSTLDLNGDGLPDRVYRDAVVFNQGSKTVDGKISGALTGVPPKWDPGFLVSPRGYGTDGRRLGKDVGNAFDASVQAFYGVGSVNVGASYTTSSSSDFVLDANGDGLPDFVNRGEVWFNQSRSTKCDVPSSTCCPAGQFCFMQSVVVPALGQLGDSEELLDADPSIAAANQAMDDELTPEDAVLEWTAPYAGAVDLAATLALVDPSAVGTAAERRDGVRLRVYRYHPVPLGAAEADLLATYLKTPGDETETPVELGGIPVQPGTILYFVLSTLSDFPMNDANGEISPIERVRFAPVITYVGKPAGTRAMLGPSGAPLYRFDAAKDFVVAGDPQGRINVPRTGRIDLGVLVKKLRTSDDVRICVQYQDPPTGADAPQPPGACTSANGNGLFRSYGAANEVAATTVTESIDVKAGGLLYFRVDTDVAIDPRAVSSVSLTASYACVQDRNACRAPKADEQRQLTFHALPYMPLHDDSIDIDRSEKSWEPSGKLSTAFRPGVSGWLYVRSAATSPIPDAPIFFTVRTLDRLLLKVEGRHPVGIFDPRPLSTITRVAAGDPVFLEAHSESARSFDPKFFGFRATWSLTCQFYPDGGMPGEYVNCAPSDMQSTFTSDGHKDSWDDGNQPLLAGGFHGWRYGAWNGKDGEEFTPWVFRGPTRAETALNKDDPEVAAGELENEDPTQHTKKKRLRLGGLLVPNATGTVLTNGGDGFEKTGSAFVSQDGNVYFADGTMHAGKKGQSASVREKDPEGAVAVPMKFAIGKIGRSSTSVSMSIGGKVGWGGIGLSRGLSQQKMDILDMNGDGIIDVVVAPGMPGPLTSASGVVNGTQTSHVRITDPVRLDTRRTLAMRGFAQISEEQSGQVNLGVSAAQRGLSPKGNTTSMTSRSVETGGGLSFATSAVLEQLADVNGDGLPDQLRRSTDGCPSGVAVRLNMGTSFATGEDCLALASDPADPVLVAAGRGAANALRRSTTVTLQGSGGIGEFTELGNLSGGIDQTESWGASISAETSITATNVALVDVTGDGLPDYVYKDNTSDTFSVRVNTGYGFATARDWKAERPWLDEPDARRPRLRLGPAQALLNAFGAGVVVPLEASGAHSKWPSFGFSVDFSFPLFIVEPWMHIGFGANVSPRKVSGFELGLQDIDGDGLVDQVLKTSENAPIWARLNQLGRSNLLKSVTRPLGGSIELAYEQRVGNTVDMPQSRWVMTKVVARDGRGTGTGHELTTEWAYENGRQDRVEREFLGFAKVTRTNPDDTSVEQEFENGDVFRKGLLVAERMKSAAGKVLVETLNTWGDKIQVGFAVGPCEDATPKFLNKESYCGSFFSKLDQVEKKFYENEPTPGVVTRQRFAYNGNGDVAGFWDDGDVVDPADDTTAVIWYFAGDKAATELHSKSRPKWVEVQDPSGRVLRSRTAEYDDNGNLTRLVSALGQGKFADTNLSWHANGLVDYVEGPENEAKQRYRTTYGYDPYALTYVASIQDSHGHLSTAEYDTRFGEPTKTTDVNGKVTARKLDAYGRATRVAGPKDTLDAPTLSITYAHAADVPYAWTRNRMPRSSTDRTTTVDTVIVMDGLARVIQTKKTAEIATSSTTKGVGWSVTGHQVFDVMGRVAAQGQMFASFNSRPEYVPGTTKNPTLRVYDELGRTIRTVEPDDSVTRVDYGFGVPAGSILRRFKTTTTDPEGKSNARYLDASERIVAVEERVDGRIPTTHYEYSPLGELVKVVDAAGNPTQLTYDLLGRRTKLFNRDTGEIRFDLDAAGNVVRKYDANLVAAKFGKPYIQYVYDHDQLVRIEYPDTTRNVTYVYGKPGTAADRNGVGRVIEVMDDGGREERSYGALGELISTTRTIGPMPPYFREQSFETSFEYDSFGRMMSITYPDGEKVQYGYDAGGLLEKATGHRSAGSAVPGDEVYLASMAYDEFGQRVRSLLGNGVASTFTYDPLTRRLASLTTVTPLGRTLQAIRYGYDRVGNVKTMVNGIGAPVGDRSGTVAFEYGYDDLHRLTSASGEAKSRVHTIDRFTATYQHSDIHNMTSNVQVHEIVHGGDGLSAERPPKTNHAFAYEYDSAAPHRARKIGDTFFVYDGNGNTLRECRDAAGDPSCGPLTDHLRTYAWSAENRLDHVIDGGGGNITRFLYDAAGDRVVKLGRGGEQITVGQFWSLKGRRAATKHVFAGNTRLASKLLPPPGLETTSPAVVVAALTVATTSATDATMDASMVGSGWPNGTGCVPSNYEPQKCPVLPGGEPDINHQYDDTRVRPETYYYHQDHLGSTSWVTDQHARVHEHVEYFPYGEVWRDPRSDADGAPVQGQRFLFTSKEMDEETGLYYMGARYLDPRRARWLSADPILDKYLPDPDAKSLPRAGNGGVYNPVTLGVYVYGHHRPLFFIDPDGRDIAFAVDPTGAAGNGHTSLYLQNQGRWVKYDQGAAGEASSGGQYGFLLGVSAPAGVSAIAVDGPPPDAVRIATTPEQDALITASALRSMQAHESGEKKYNLYTNNCTDAAVDAVNESGAGIEIPNSPFTVRPNSWFKQLKEWTTKNSTALPPVTPAAPENAPAAGTAPPPAETAPEPESSGGG